MTDASPRPTPAEVYERAFVPGMFRPLTTLVVDLAAPAAGERVLDLACGTGVVARAVAPLVGPTGRVVGLDLRPGMLAVAASASASLVPAIDWVEGDATALRFPADSFDLLVCQQGLQFFADRRAALLEMRRVLRPGGRVVLAVWDSIERQPLMHALTEVELRHLGPLGLTREDAIASFLLNDRDDIASLLLDAGFLDLSVDTTTIETDFAAATFVEDVEFAYAAVFPEFIEHPEAHLAFVDAVSREAGPVIERYRVHDRLRSPMATHLAVAVVPD